MQSTTDLVSPNPRKGDLGYEYQDERHSHSHAYLLPAVMRMLENLKASGADTSRIFDLGCGNGSTANFLNSRGFHVDGVDPSEEGVRHAHRAYPHLRIEAGSSYEDLSSRFGTYPIVVNLEVVEHVYAPRQHMKTIWELLQPGGHAIISTPYHGYVKNLALAITGKMDQHFTALWDHGHIKFWSVPTLRQLLSECGFRTVEVLRVGRIPAMAKSMIFAAQKTQ